MCYVLLHWQFTEAREADEQKCEVWFFLLKQWAEILFTLSLKEAGNTLFIYRTETQWCSCVVLITHKSWVFLRPTQGKTFVKSDCQSEPTP